jgi:branched-chain amino acid transport system permease protein
VCSGLPDPTSTLLAPVNLFGVTLDTQRALYYVAFVQLVLFLAAARLWRDHGLARLLVAVRDNEAAAAAAGVRVVRAKLIAFALSGFMAGSAGVTFALIEQRVKAGLFSVDQSILVVSMVVIGGLGSVEGAVLGAAYLVGLPAAFGHGTTVQFLCSGVGLLVFVLYLPGGLADLLNRVGDRLAVALAGLRRRGPPPSPPMLAQPGEAPPASDLAQVLVEVGP